MSWEGVASLTAAIVSIIGAIVAIEKARLAAKESKLAAKASDREERESEFNLLRGMIRELQIWRDDAKKRLEAQEKRIAWLEQEVARWKAYAMSLCDWVRAKGLEPPSIEDTQ